MINNKKKLLSNSLSIIKNKIFLNIFKNDINNLKFNYHDIKSFNLLSIKDKINFLIKIIKLYLSFFYFVICETFFFLKKTILILTPFFFKLILFLLVKLKKILNITFSNENKKKLIKLTKFINKILINTLIYFIKNNKTLNKYIEEYKIIEKIEIIKKKINIIISKLKKLINIIFQFIKRLKIDIFIYYWIEKIRKFFYNWIKISEKDLTFNKLKEEFIIICGFIKKDFFNLNNKIYLKKEEILSKMVKEEKFYKYTYLKIYIKDSKKIYGYHTFINSLFLIILLMNLFGIFPYIFSITTHISVTIGLSLIIIMYCFINSLFTFSINFFSIFVPKNSPLTLSFLLSIIETLSYIARIISLGIRLAANICAGHLLISIVSTFGFNCSLSNYWIITIIFPSILLCLIILLELCVAIIQSYIFITLSVIYINESFNISESYFQNYNIIYIKKISNLYK